MEKTKLYERDYYNMIIDMAKPLERIDIIDFCNKKIEQINNKNLKARAKDNSFLEIADMVLKALSENKEKMTLSEILQNEAIKNYTYVDNKEIKHVTSQKLNAVLNSLVTPGEDCKVVKIQEKRKIYYTLI